MNKQHIEQLRQNLNNIESLIDNWDNLDNFGDELYNNLQPAKEIDYKLLTEDEHMSLNELKDKIYMIEQKILANRHQIMQSMTTVKKHKSAQAAYNKNQ